jgi:hypothetical protein
MVAHSVPLVPLPAATHKLRGVLQVDTFAHNKSGITYQDKNGLREIVVDHKNLCNVRDSPMLSAGKDITCECAKHS